jgi:adenylate cyclase
LNEKLREYYGTEGQSDAIHIDLPKGTYAPLIEFREGEQQVKSVSKRRTRWQTTVPVLAQVLGMPEGPAIAVLPFANLSDDPKQEYFSDGLTEDLMTALSRASSDLRVLARNTTFQYKGRAVDVPKLGRELGVRYVLEGGVRRADDGLRITAQLIDTQTGAHIWADRFDRKMADIFLVQDEIVSQIVAKIAGGYGVIEITEGKSAAHKSPEEIRAYDLVLRAHDAIMWEWNRETFGAAKELLRQAIALDPVNARARRELAYLAVIGWVFRFDETPVPPQGIAALASKAVQLDPGDARAHMVAATAYFFNKQLDLFEREAQQAIALAPSDGEILAVLGSLMAHIGQRERGVALAKKANALNADAAIGWYQATLYYDYYLNGDYERALEFRRLHPDQQAIHGYIEYIPVYGQLGRTQEALENWRKLLADVPGWTAESFEAWYHLWNLRDEDIAKLMDGVTKSGVLEAEAKPGQ